MSKQEKCPHQCEKCSGPAKKECQEFLDLIETINKKLAETKNHDKYEIATSIILQIADSVCQNNYLESLGLLQEAIFLFQNNTREYEDLTNGTFSADTGDVDAILASDKRIKH
jgi:hypothetical protein